MGKNNKEEYRANDLVFGQLRGYPWWPGYVMRREPSGEYKVVFFGDFTYALLSAKKIRRFSGSSRKFDKKNQKLTQAIKSALRVLNRESSIKQETEAVLRPAALLAAPAVAKPRAKPRPEKPKPKTRKIKKPEAKERRKPPRPGASVRRQKRKKPAALELVNDGEPRDSLAEQPRTPREASGLDEGLSARGRLNKMSLSLGPDDAPETLKLGLARSERAKAPERGFFDEVPETKSVRPSGKPLQFGCGAQGRPAEQVHALFARGGDESGIAELNQTKNSLRSIEAVQRLLTKPSPQRSGQSLELQEVIDLDAASESVSNCPSISSKGFGPGFGDIEREMQELLEAMRKTQSTGGLEEKLRKWRRDLSARPDFRSIVGTKIGRHLSHMKSFCSDRLEETAYYDGVLAKIKNFENIIINRIKDTFFGCAEPALLPREPPGSCLNPSPASKDLTLFNQSFPSPRFDARRKFELGPNVFAPRDDKLRRALLQTHREPAKAPRPAQASAGGVYFGGFDAQLRLPTSVNEFGASRAFEGRGALLRAASERGASEKTRPGKSLRSNGDAEDASVLTMKKDADAETHWNTDNAVDAPLQRRVAAKIAKKLFLMRGVPQMKSGTVERLGAIIEEIVRTESLGKAEYQRQVLRILGSIERSGAQFYCKFLSQRRGVCQVHRLKLLLRQQMRSN